MCICVETFQLKKNFIMTNSENSHIFSQKKNLCTDPGVQTPFLSISFYGLAVTEHPYCSFSSKTVSSLCLHITRYITSAIYLWCTFCTQVFFHGVLLTAICSINKHQYRCMCCVHSNLDKN